MVTDELLKRLLGKMDELNKRMERLFVSTESMFDVLDKHLPIRRDSDVIYDPGIRLANFTVWATLNTFLTGLNKLKKFPIIWGWMIKIYSILLLFGLQKMLVCGLRI